MSNEVFSNSFSEEVWTSTYKDHKDRNVQDTFTRVAKAVASVEKTEDLQKKWEKKFFKELSQFKFVPGGRILANAGTEWKNVGLINCFAAETEVLTKDGIQPIKNLANKTVQVLNKDRNWIGVKFSCFGKQQLYKVSFSNGDIIYSTEKHRWLVKKKKNTYLRECSTIDLVGKNVPYIFPESNSIIDNENFLEGVKHGLVYGDGGLYLNGKYSLLHQFGDSCHLVEDYFDSFTEGVYKNPEIRKVSVTKLPPHYKTTIPQESDHIDYIKGYIAGLVASDGCVDSKGSVLLFQSDEEFLYQIRLLAAKCGIVTCSIRLFREFSPFNGKYAPNYKLTFLKSSFPQEMILKNKHKEYSKNHHSNHLTFEKSLKVVSVEKTDRFENVYCCEEPETGTFTLGNFLLTGNCFTGGRPPYDCDSLVGILEVLKGQSLTLKSEGGWGLNFSFIRPRGTFIHGVGVESPGPVKFMELFDKSSDVITAGSNQDSVKEKKKAKIRKGAQMAILSCWHPSIFEFVTAKQTEGRLTKFNISVYCTDEFMDKVLVAKNGDTNVTWDLVFPDTKHPKYKEDWDGDIFTWKSKGYDVVVYETIPVLKLWNLIIKSTYNRAEPGVLFLDKANQTYCFNYSGKRIQETNACCFSKSSEVEVITNNGPKEIKTVTSKDLVWINSESEFVKTNGYFDAGMQDVYQISFSNGTSLEITNNHKFCTPFRKRVGSKLTSSEGDLIELKNLKIGDKICVHDTVVKDVKFGNLGCYDEGLIMGWLCGDGHLTFGNVADAYPRLRLDFWKNEHDSIHFFDDALKNLGYCLELCSITRNNNEVRFFASTKFAKDFIYKYQYNIWNFKGETQRIPFLENASENFIKGFIQAYFTADGIISPKTSSTHAIQLPSINKNRLIQIQSILNLYGIKSGFGLLRKAGESEFKNCGKYQTKDCWRITITGHKNILNFHTYFGFLNKAKQDRLEEYTQIKELRTAVSTTTIQSIKFIGQKEVGCIEVPKHHKFTANGIISGNSEQTMPPFSSCNLLSINLVKLFNLTTKKIDFNQLESTARIALRFSDNVNDLTSVPLEEYTEAVKDFRRVGIGILGWASLLYMLKIKFASKEAESLKNEIMQTICYSIIDESVELAKEKGMFKDCIPEKHADCGFFDMIKLPEPIKDKVKKHGVRNSSFFSIQPTGNTSIFANNISGGCEPIFLQEYIRTVIVQNCPKELLSIVPKYWEGEFVETDVFKFTKEGDEQILTAIIDGIKYKIDKNRGLTKEVLCQDYSVFYLKSINEWDERADWAVTTEKLTVEEHLSDMKEFTRWLDASCSKTINIPNDYPFDKFENVYLEAYKTGTIKGITTYRAGTMTSVLASTEEKIAKISRTQAPKRAKEMPCFVDHLTVKGHRYYTVVGLLKDDPYEIFVGNNHDSEGDIIIPKSVKEGKVVKVARGSYKLISDDSEFIISNGHTDPNADALTRMVSTSLRHGVDISFVVHQLEKTKGDMTSFAKALGRTLKKYINNGERVYGESCLSCGSAKLVRESGCILCKECGWSKCA
ncbi:MAG: LAGLIDADG family homing endonuclease [Sulfurimonas sp.]|jgi:ribonucleotide reductase alpha subunit